jgi:cytochrome c
MPLAPQSRKRHSCLAKLKVLIALLLFSSASVVSAAGQATKSAGEALYQAKCGGCHALDENRIGPRHRGVVGRRIASLSDFDYSPAIKKLHGVWTTASLDKWLQGPQNVAPGTKMYFSVADPNDRKMIIAYLASLSTPAVKH